MAESKNETKNNLVEDVVYHEQAIRLWRCFRGLKNPLTREKIIDFAKILSQEQNLSEEELKAKIFK